MSALCSDVAARQTEPLRELGVGILGRVGLEAVDAREQTRLQVPPTRSAGALIACASVMPRNGATSSRAMLATSGQSALAISAL
jgi:hypothetical protein